MGMYSSIPPPVHGIVCTIQFAREPLRREESGEVRGPPLGGSFERTGLVSWPARMDKG